LNLSIESITTAALSLALDAAGVRQQVHAANIAHAARPGHAAQRASFEAVVSALDRGAPAAGAATSFYGAAAELRARITAIPAPDGGPLPVHLDAEVAELSRNAFHYHALVKGLRAHLGLISLAVTEGRR
jgi:flagellar basal-body rod protein FlgB